MSTDRIYARIGRFTNISTIQGARARFNEQADAIRKNDTLSDKGKRIAIAREYTATREKLATHRAEFEEGARKERLRVERNTFGPATSDPFELIHHRDAFDRAERLETPEQAAKLYHQAQMSGDVGLARAVAYKAVQATRTLLGGEKKDLWKEVVESHQKDNPAFADRVTEIRDLEPSTESALVDNIVFGLSAPDEFKSYDAAGIAAFAAAADRAEEADGDTTDEGPGIL